MQDMTVTQEMTSYGQLQLMDDISQLGQQKLFCYNYIFQAMMVCKQLCVLIIMAAFLTICVMSCNSTYPYSYNSICYQQCPWNNTLITYLNNNTFICQTNCTSGTFADDSTQTCVSICPSSPIQTYYDFKYNRCVFQCSSNPLTFAYSNYTCVQYCPSPTFGDQQLQTCVNNCSIDTFYQIYNNSRLCVDQCYPNFYANITKYCIGATSCPSSPVAYYGDDSTGLCVIKCPISRGTFADNSTRKCVLYCPLGSFADSKTQICVAQCPLVPSYFGSNTTRNCLLQCNQGEFADPITRQCTYNCSAGSYGDYSTRKCVTLCPITQNTFADQLTRLCVPICPANYYGDANSRSCVSAINCTNSTFGDPVTQLCVSVKGCSLGFYVDTTQSLCVVRCTGWANTLTGLCESSCPWNPPVFQYYMDPSTNICVLTCPRNPVTFGDPTSRTCVSKCSNGSFANPLTMVCVATCPTGFFANPNLNLCVAQCTQNTTFIFFFYSINQTCLSSCPVGYFADNATLSCTLSCSNQTFGDPITGYCLSQCAVGWFGDNYTLTCVQSCSEQTSTYADPSTNLCVLTCPSNPDYYGQNINDGNKTCVANCSISGFFADPLTRTCVYVCNSLLGYYGNPSDQRCYTRCPIGYGNPINSQCVTKCPSKPKYFYADNLTGLCVLSCPNETYGNPSSNQCVNSTNCTGNLVGDDASGRCVSQCPKLLNLYSDFVIKKCVQVCTFPNYADPYTRLCSSSCSALLFKDNSTSTCVKTCSSLPDFYGDPNSGFCEYNCTNNWFSYAYGPLRVCLAMCPSNPPMLADMQSYHCVTKCANGTFAFINNTFRACLDYCPPQVYNATLQISLFADNTTWVCVVVCPYGYYAFSHPTDTNIRVCVLYCPIVSGTFYFAQDSTRTCVNTCPLLYQSTYADNITLKCSQTCSRNQFKDNSTATCVYHCPNGTYANNITWNCSTWCQSGYFGQNINNTCVKTCPSNLYGYKGYCITQCPNNTHYYNDNTSWFCVDKCPSYPNTFADNTTDACVLQCSSWLYADTSTRTCVLPINCTQPTIADPISGQCLLQCTKNPMYYLTIETNTCGQFCTNGTFAYNQTNVCLNQCPQPYFGVNTTSNYYCTQFCPPLLYMWVNLTTRMCIPGCPTGLYRDNLTMSCVKTCPDYTYANVSNTLCVSSCAPLYGDGTTKSCVSICPNGTTASNSSYLCRNYCTFGQFMLDKVCYSSCPSGLFADNLTRACVSNCSYYPLTFADPLNNSCVFTCQPGQYAILSNRTCSTSCPPNYYRQLTLQLCLSVCLQDYFSDNYTQNCVSSCNASIYPYADPTSQSCVSICPKNPDLYGYNYQCLTQCPPGYYAQNFTRTCMSVCPNVSSVYLNASWADQLTRRCLSKCSSLSYAYTNTTNNVCLNICPNNSYASIQDQACLQNCTFGTFAYNTTNTCVDQCPPGQWADLDRGICMPNCSFNSSLYADDSSTSCVEKCPTYPDMFADLVSQKCVLSCPNGTYAYNITRVCVSNCTSPYLADPYLLECVLFCSISELSFADITIGQCVSTCTNHTINNVSTLFYQDNSTLTCVKQCPSFPAKLYGHNESNVCVQGCPDGTYGDNDTRVCLDKCIFQSPKFTWKDDLSNFCVTLCPYGYYADNITGSCAQTCTNGSFADSSTRRCVINCPNNPTSYSVMLNNVGVCTYNCPNGTFSSEVSISCVTTCPKLPTIYYTYTPTNACVKQCVYPYFADTTVNACIQNCAVGYYGNLTTKRCQICQVQCVTCSGYLVCKSCITGFYLYESTCILTCPTYPVMYFSNKQAGICNTTCPSPYFGQVTTGICQLTCPSLKYANTVTRICTTCPSGCILCDQIGCYTCSSGYTFLPSALMCNKNCNSTAIYYYLGICYFSCPSGSYLSYDLVNCLSCSSPCATCVGTSGNCTACVASYYYLGQCLNACPTNFYVDSRLNCISCTSNPSKCSLPPLTYTVFPFTANYQLQAYVVFNRQVSLTISQFISTVQITYNGQSIKSSQFTAFVYNSTTFLVIFKSGGSLNQNSLSFSFTPGTITDQYGNILTTVTVSQNVTVNTGINAQITAAATPINNTTYIITIILLVLLGLFLVKSGYPALIIIQALQFLHLHIFLYCNPLPYLEYNFLDNLKYFNFMFLPTLFQPLNITNTFYAVFTQDISFLSNSPIILIFAVVISIYMLVSFLSSKRFIANKHIRKLFKKIRKYRMKYGIIHDAFWISFPYGMLISLLQFKFASFSGGSLYILNMLLAISTFLILNAFFAFVVYQGYKYRNQPQKIPKKYSFLQLQPSNFTLQMPMRYGRKLLFVIALLLSSLQSQVVALLAINISFLLIYLCLKPSKSPLTNKICIAVELLMIILESLFLAYDKLITKSVNNQLGFSIGMIIIQSLLILILLVWAFYRLFLVIKQTDTFKQIINKITQRTDFEYLQEQQRKRDLEFDFGGLQNKSQDERTDNPINKTSAKRSVTDEKFNIFEQSDAGYQARDLQKPLKSVKKQSRPGSVDSSQKMALNSISSQGKIIFEPNKSANNFRRRNHLQINHIGPDDSIEQVQISPEKRHKDQQSSRVMISNTEDKQQRVVWQDIDFDQNEI